MATKTDAKTDKITLLAPLYRVLLHNDPVSTASVVVEALIRYFDKPFEGAWKVTLRAHRKGVALVCVLPREQAEFRIEQAHSYARARKMPLTLTMEPA